MSEAVGIHDHPTRKLGRKPNDPSKPRLKLSQFLAVPPTPPAEDYSAIDEWDMFANDQYGDCGPADVAHSRMQVSQYLGGTLLKPTQNDVFDLYRRSGNPNFPQDDNGVIMQDMFNAVRTGGIAGIHCLAFAEVDHTNPREMDAAIALFGGLHLGVTLETAQQSQTDNGVWDYSHSGIWGGHAVYMVGYGGGEAGRVVTWGEEVQFTEAFAQHQIDEAWVVIWPEHTGSAAFLEGIDQDALASAFKELTKEDLPNFVPPAPPPEPGPPAPPSPAPSSGADVDQVTAALLTAAEQTTGEQATMHMHREHSRRRLFECGGFEIIVHDDRP